MNRFRTILAILSSFSFGMDVGELASAVSIGQSPDWESRETFVHASEWECKRQIDGTFSGIRVTYRIGIAGQPDYPEFSVSLNERLRDIAYVSDIQGKRLVREGLTRDEILTGMPMGFFLDSPPEESHVHIFIRARHPCGFGFKQLSERIASTPSSIVIERAN